MPKQQKLYIVRKEFDGLGGAENIAKHMWEYFSESFNTQLVYAGAELESYRFAGKERSRLVEIIIFLKLRQSFLLSQKQFDYLLA